MWFIMVLLVAVSAKKCPPHSGPKPQHCGANETYVKCKTICPPQSCDLSYTDYACDKHIPCTPGCDCIKNHLRNSDGDCILNDDCPPGPKPQQCGANETYVECKTICPPQSCEISYTDYACNQPILCTPGCDCIENHLRNPAGDCILNDDCPPPPQASKCGPNEKEVECKTTCPPQSCDIAYTEYLCSANITCTSGCDCIANHLRNSDGECIPSDECPPLQTVDESTKPPVKSTSKPPSTKPRKTKSTSSSASSSSSSHSEAKSSSSSSSTSSDSSKSKCN